MNTDTDAPTGNAIVPLFAAIAILAVIAVSCSGCVSADIGVAKVGLTLDRARFANGGIELEGTAYARITALQGIRALLNIESDGILMETLPATGEGAGANDGDTN